VATEAARLNRKNLHLGGKRKIDRKRKTDLTLTGLLMEGTSTIVSPDSHSVTFVCKYSPQ
jgi:hypothetical protein